MMAEIGLEQSNYEDKPLRVFPIQWKRLEELHPHEAINEAEMEALLESLRSMGTFFKPLLVDRDSGTVLDGTHRWAGLKRLGTTRAPTINLDYLHDNEIELYTWFPVCDLPVEQILSVFDGLGVNHERISDSDRPKDFTGPHLLSPEGNFRLEATSLDLFFRLEEEFDFSYTDTIPPEVSECCVFYREPPDRAEVVELARDGRTVPAKSTRHWLPYKYQHIMIPLEELTDGGTG